MRCLMPGARSWVKPLTAGESSGSSASDEVSQLELHLQQQLEEDIASDAYTECNIQHQEKEIINYLNENLNLVKTVAVKNTPKNKSEEKDELDVYSTPSCVSPNKSFHKTLSSSPSTELTKEYYALVPIDGNILDKELIEQDALSNAFQCINKSQVNDLNGKQNQQCVKPTSLFLNSSHIPKINKHSNSCDISSDADLKSIGFIKTVNNLDGKKVNNSTSQTRKSIKQSETDKSVAIPYRNSNLPETSIEKVAEPPYSPDSLITDEPSSSSDYLSAAYAGSPGAVSSSGLSQLNVGENVSKMENIITISDSGLETNGMLESLNSHKDVTLTDVSLTESTFHDMINDDAICHNSLLLTRSTSQHSSTGGTSTGKDLMDRKSNKPTLTEMSGTSTKEEKQRQNEEIVILESSSLSSETGSWESVFPPKLPEKDLCEKFIHKERQNALEVGNYGKPHGTVNIQHQSHDELCPSLVQKSPFKSTSCFIDAASLADEGDEAITVHPETNEVTATMKSDNNLAESSRPVACVFKRDQSPNDWSGSNDNDDSLEQADKQDTDSIQKDLSPTIFEMTPITEDSLCGNTFETVPLTEQKNINTTQDSNIAIKNPGEALALQNNASSTPNNSIISVPGGGPDFKMYESEESESDATVVRRSHNHLNSYEDVTQITPHRTLNYNKMLKNNDSPILSGGVSVEDHLPQLGSGLSGSPLMRQKIENTPIVSGAYVPEPEEKPEKSVKIASNASFWVVDMSNIPKSDVSECSIQPNNKGADKTCVILRPASKSTSSVETCKSRSSVDSDSSEKSTHKFYIDLSTLPDAMAQEQKHEGNDTNEKKNIFSMFIDLGDKSTLVKEMPARLSSSLNTKKSNKTETKCSSKGSKTPKTSSLLCVTGVANNRDDGSTLFEKLESLCNDPSISISEIISNPDSHTEDGSEVSSSFNKENELVKKTIEEEQNNDLFVKLSDLDKPGPKAEPLIFSLKKECHERMTRSIPDNDWRESSQTVNLRSSEIISSFHSENALSLNRLFPHLKNDFSRSMPGSLSSRTKSPLRLGVSSSPGDIDEHASDMSEMSSVQSSYCRSVVENSTTEETDQTSSLISNCQSRLGQDLLRMFLEEIAPDVIVEVSGRRIKAHKCILSSRCQYFAGILSGGWVESAGNVIALPPFSFSVVHFALCHIYSGVSMIPDSISIVELATLADMLGLEGLKEAIMFTLKAKYCHHFHKVCTAGVLECFPLSSVYGLDDLYRKCLRWITKHFHKVWPTKAFATLPSELLDKCYQEHIVNLTTDNIVETVYGCGITVASLQSSRWAETVARMCRRLVNAAAHFAAPRLSSVLRAMSALPPDAPPPAAQALDDCLAAAIEWAPPDEACRAYAFLSALVKEIRASLYSKPELISNGGQPKPAEHGSLLCCGASGWRLQCEGALVRAAPRVVGTQAFKDLPADLRKRLRELGCIMFGAHAMPASCSPLPPRKTRSAHSGRAPPKLQNPAASRSLDIDRVRACFVPYAPKPQPQVRSIDSLPTREARAPKLNKTVPPSVRTTKAQQERAKYNLIKTNQSQERLNCKAPPRAVFENTKPRYLEPRPVKERKMPLKKPQPKMVSSSESSRNSSPVQARAARVGRGSQDSRAASRPRTADPSTDSLTESQGSNKYATYTKARHTTKGSVESVTIQPSKCHPVTASMNNKGKTTKIPVYLNQSAKSCNAVSASTKDSQRKLPTEKTLNSTLSPISQPRNKTNERKSSGSLMNATKSSQAKMVPKIVKETSNNKYAAKQEKQSKCMHGAPRSPLPGEIPVMERSGTFLKDEPMFGDKTTNIDIDE